MIFGRYAIGCIFWIDGSGPVGGPGREGIAPGASESEEEEAPCPS